MSPSLYCLVWALFLNLSVKAAQCVSTITAVCKTGPGPLRPSSHRPNRCSVVYTISKMVPYKRWMGHRARPHDYGTRVVQQNAVVRYYLPPRVVLLVLGRRVPGGGGGGATSSQSSEPRGGRPTPCASTGGRSLRGETGVGNAFTSSASSCASPKDTRPIEAVMSLETQSASNGPRRTRQEQTYSSSDERLFAHCRHSSLKPVRRTEKSWWN